MRRCIFMCLSVLSVSACATLPDEPTQNTKAIAGAVNQLPAQSLQTGECGLFVWTAGSERRFILFAQSQKFTAIFQGGKAQTQLTIDSQDGLPTQKQFPIQSYSGGQTLRLLKAQRISDGTRYKAGTLSYTVDGWDSVIPVVGLSACR